ncbi:MAG TPA: hypothetical protein VM053_05415 [Gemmatimonadaceae bacterium]|nr:hypothetical protein [Gemmatimonadaceae bacterium]
MTDGERKPLPDRRAFLRTASYAAAVAFSPRIVRARTIAGPSLTIGLILPEAETGASADALAGIQLGVEETGRSAALFQKGVTLTKRFFSSASNASLTAASLIRDDHATVLIGGGNEDECRRIADVCTMLGAVFMNVISRSDALRRSNCSRFLLHVEPSAAMYASAGRLAAEQTSPGPPQDCVVVSWHPSLERYGASQLNDRFGASAHRAMTGYSWAGWMAVKAAAESFLRVGANDGDTLATYMNRETTQFDGHKGAPLSFRAWDHQLRQPLYCVTTSGSGVSTVRDVPDVARSPRPARKILDELGDADSAGLCRVADR